jgi:FixJ family two-component response regulator
MGTSIARLLKIYGIVVELYNSAEDFLGRLDASKADCALIDIHLGGLSGIELHRPLAASGRIAKVIVMTAMENKANGENAFKAGCTAFLHKPFPARSLIDVVENN